MAKSRGTYDFEDLGWFPVSRRITESSRWFTSSAAAIKLLIYMLNKASNPMNPTPGDVMQTGHALAAMCGLGYDETQAALAELMSPDPESHSSKDDGSVVSEIQDDGKVVGYRLTNFHEYNPKAAERSAAKMAERRKQRAEKAAATRWDKAREAISSAHKAELDTSFISKAEDNPF